MDRGEQFEKAFPDIGPLRRAAQQVIDDSDRYEELEPLIDHIYALQQTIADLRSQVSTATNGALASKKRKLEPGEHESSPNKSIRPSGKQSLVAKDISFSLPIRKKLTLELIEGVSYKTGGLRAVNASSGDVEAAIAWADLDQIFRLPVPDKMQPSFNFVILPHSSSSSTNTTPPLVFTLASTSAPSSLLAPSDSTENPPTYPDLLRTRLNAALKPLRKSVLEPSPHDFSSAIPQSHRKGEVAFHVKAHRGVKEGYLYFLSGGILFGFKKPILWFPFAAINSVSYTSVLARTFNLVVNATSEADEGKDEDVEFSMLDQADHGGIDRYVKAHSLQDASLAKKRKARRYNVNKDEAANGDGDPLANGYDGEVKDEDEEEDEDPQTAAQRAERALQDREDEEEEDFDPGSEGESEGSGSSEDEDDDNGEGGQDDEREME